MPPVRTFLSSTDRRACTATFILSLGEVMPTCSRCADKKLVYIAIAAPSSRQPSSCFKCTSANMRSSCDVRSVSNAKYTSCISHCCLRLPYSSSRNT